MKKIVSLIPISDYIRSRRHIGRSIVVSIIPAILSLIYTCVFNIKKGVKIDDVFSASLGIQINAIAILISFSVAIITILVSSSSTNIEKLRKITASEKNYKPLKGVGLLTLFQILLSNIAYNTIIEVLYLLVLVAEMFLQYIVPIETLKYLAALNIFFIVHILYTLLESIAQMYFTFWKEIEEEEK